MLKHPFSEVRFSSTSLCFWPGPPSGDSTSTGGSVDVDDRDDQLPWCMVNNNGKDCGMLSEGSLMEVEVESGSFGEWTRTENFSIDSEIRYESWEESCLVKFSEFLGFSTKGHEREISFFFFCGV